MFSPAFDWTLAAIFGVLAVVFFLGHGQGVLDAFSGKYKQKKMSPEQNLKYQRGVGVFLLVLAVSEVFMAAFPGFVMGVISIIIAVVALIGIVVYIRKLLGE